MYFVTSNICSALCSTNTFFSTVFMKFAANAKAAIINQNTGRFEAAGVAYSSSFTKAV